MSSSGREICIKIYYKNGGGAFSSKIFFFELDQI
jgi:hypothetical protein